MVFNREARIQDKDPQERTKGFTHSRTEGIPQNPSSLLVLVLGDSGQESQAEQPSLISSLGVSGSWGLWSEGGRHRSAKAGVQTLRVDKVRT